MVDLPAPFGPDEAEDLARLDGQVHAGDGERVGVALDQTLGADDRASSDGPP